MEPMDVLEVLLLMIAMRPGILEIAVGPWGVGKEPTGDGEARQGAAAPTVPTTTRVSDAELSGRRRRWEAPRASGKS